MLRKKKKVIERIARLFAMNISKSAVGIQCFMDCEVQKENNLVCNTTMRTPLFVQRFFPVYTYNDAIPQ